MIPGRSLALSKWQILDLKNRSLGQGMHPSGRFWPWHLTLLSPTRHRYGCPERKGTCPGQSCPCTEGPDRRLGVQNLLSVPVLTPLQTSDCCHPPARAWWLCVSSNLPKLCDLGQVTRHLWAQYHLSRDPDNHSTHLTGLWSGAELCTRPRGSPLLPPYGLSFESLRPLEM